MKRVVVLSVVAGVATASYAVIDLRRAMIAWTAAFGFGVTTAIGALILVAALHLGHGRWWLPLRRVFVAPAALVPLFALFFVPIALFLRHVYPWVAPSPDLDEAVRAALEHQRRWNQPGFFIARAAFHFAVWTGLAWLLLRQDTTDEGLARSRQISAIALPVVGFGATSAAFDWLMSTEAGWTSTIYGLYVVSGGAVAAASVAAIGVWAARDRLRPDHAHAVGRLLFTTVLLWAYLGFFQLLLIWIADLPREIPFYVARVAGSWAIVDVVLVVGHFLLPFLALLSRPLKRRPGALALVGAWLLVMHALDLAWLVLPSSGARLAPLDLAPFVFVGATAWFFGARLTARPIPETPAIREGLGYRSP